ncbi:glycosyltransferase family 2 protein [Halolamina sp. C58]|uniref:glycosyltransferase family 2 protein n=1 Tax=Halolamina sp. C58 TaxID=3421640 RepID=UPI003EBC231A
MTEPLVSAVIPSYNRPERTQRAINSVRDQTYGNIELIVVDDGSDTPVSEVINAPQNIPYEFIRHNTNKGANIARTTGIEAADGDYIAFLDSDDEWRSKKITKQIDAINSGDAEAAYTTVKNVDSDGELIQLDQAMYSGDIQTKLLRYNVVGTFSSLLISSSVVNKIGYPDPDLACWQDWEWYLRLSDVIKFVPIQEPLTIRHIEGGHISKTFGPDREVAYQTLKQRLKDRAESVDEAQVAIAHLKYRFAYIALTNNEFTTARRYILQAIRAYPWNLSFYKHFVVAGPHYSVAKKVRRKVVQMVSRYWPFVSDR